MTKEIDWREGDDHSAHITTYSETAGTCHQCDVWWILATIDEDLDL